MKLMILDGNSIVNRAYYGVRLLTTKEGIYTNAIFGFLNILEKLRSEERPDALCVAFDLRAPTFRHLRYDAYKATRHGMPEELAMQMPYLKEVLSAMNIPMYALEGWEADDILGTVGVKCADLGWDCVIVTGDRDSLQLVDEHVHIKLVSSKAGQTISTLYDPQTFASEYGFEPKKMVDLKGLMGDSSDNIPGVAGVGPKTATQLLLDYGSLQGVYDHLDAIKPNLRAKLEADRDNAFLSYELATIRCDAPIDFTLEDNLVREFNVPALYDLFLKLEFIKLIDRYHLRPEQSAPSSKGLQSRDYQTVTTRADADALLAHYASCEAVSVLVRGDFDAVGVDDGAQITWFACDNLPLCFDGFLQEFFSERIRKRAHDVKELSRRLLARSLPAEAFVFDTALAGYVIDPTQGSYDLSRLCVSYLSAELPTDDSFDALSMQLAAITALHQPLLAQMEQFDLPKLYFEIELPLCKVLAQMEVEGILVDQFALLSFGTMLQERIDASQALIFEAAGEGFNINSPKQLGEILFEKLGLPPVKKTKSGYSTNADVLEKLRAKHPIIDAILDYRMLTKLKSTYADGLLKQIADDGRIHTSFQNMVTATGRLSSTNPNLQNIPVRSELGSEIRKMFIPADGCVLIDADYSQIELRVLAHIADDSRMREAFLSGTDIHTATAAQVFGVEPESVTPLMRRNAKAVNFGIVYGISEFSLAEDIGVSRYQAKEYIENYLANFSGVRDYMHRIVEQAKADGFVSTLYGRRRELPELKSSNFNLRAFGERVALNSPIQGTAADIIKIAMIRVSEALKAKKLRAKLLLQVHDELIVECPMQEAEQVVKIVTEEMQKAAALSVPLIAEAKSGASWYEAK